jgi:prepilin-type N-terminal cleavage/methylation domain-containing protein
MTLIRSHNKGFTLLEVMVVITIIVIISGLSMLALNQASDRRYFSQAENLLVWLQQMSELAVLEGVTYGLVRNEQTLHSMVFYRQRWYQAAVPEPFLLYEDAVINLSDNGDFSLTDTEDEMQNNPVLPEFVLLPNGYLEPALSINLTFNDQNSTYRYHWDDQAYSLIMETSIQ